MKKSKFSFWGPLIGMIFMATITVYGFYIELESQPKFTSPANMGGVAIFMSSLVLFGFLALFGLILAFLYRKKNPSAACGYVCGVISTIFIAFIYMSKLKYG
ncbi:hypothetical protein [Fusobacterium sp. PH5-44]|uniref:hypothetical protein n=1 Tax=unclassified Fusobacterium TaxID=2648384 RepID=UPI003D25A154